MMRDEDSRTAFEREMSSYWIEEGKRLQMDLASVYLFQIRDVAKSLEAIVDNVPDGTFNSRPGPRLNTVGWNYFHLLRVWDMYFNWECRGMPPEQDAWHRGGFTKRSGYNPDGKGGKGLGIGFGYSDEEVDELQIEPHILKGYQRMMLGEIEAFLECASNEDLQRETRSYVHQGQISTVAERMYHLVVHSAGHAGEMKYAMGMLGWHDPSYPGSTR